MTLLSSINIILSLGVVISNIAIIAAVIYFLFFRHTKNAVTKYISQRGIWMAFVVALFSTLASLFYSQIAGFAPCDLCWFQRIFMYPLVFLLGLALLKKDSRVVDYALMLAIAGGLVSLYHNYVYYINGGLCLVTAQGVSCGKRYVFEFGYVTIPLMALTAFALMIIFLVFKKQEQT